MDRRVEERLSAVVKTGQLLWNEPLSRHTTFGIGGPAETFIRPGGSAELASVLRVAAAEKVPVHFLGSGSNVLMSDEGVSGMVISLAGTLQDLQVEGRRVRAGAGVMLGHLVRVCLKRGLAGVESLVGIPGTVGGALVMNAGAFEGEISTHLKQVRVLTLGGTEKSYRREDLTFGYRSSSLKPDEVIVEAEFEFPAGSHKESSALKRRVSQERKARQPLRYRSAGSVFKNPKAAPPAGMLIDRAGLKGTRRGDAEISTRHANFIINRGHATAEDVAFLIKLATRTVKQQAGVQLELEIKTLGFPEGYWKDAGLA